MFYKNEFTKENESIIVEMFTMNNQTYSKEDLKKLRDEYNIFFMTSGDGVIPVMVDGDLLILGGEDDGTIFFYKDRLGNYYNKFSAYWLKYFISDLEAANKYIESKHGGKSVFDVVNKQISDSINNL